ncbi:hypothetical protein HUJ05_010250 [Dendroctonus ponderosae]|nr:hypothetical protein HUJ05_010250 [Dendroctonus ponderosae]
MSDNTWFERIIFQDSTDTHLDISTEAVEICEDRSTTQHNRPNNVNGSIITMTLKNNHLIVETEERNDIEEDSRETTVRYSPSTRDGVFVVEVQQGVRRSPGSGGPTSLAEPERSGSLSDECALVHNPPERFSDEETLEECDGSEYSPETASQKISLTDISSQAKTGLSTSNTSLGSQRQSYCYTSQYCYDQGNYGYNVYLGYPNNSSSGRIAENNKPKITSALYKTTASRGVKSMSFDVDSNDRLREKLVLSHNSSLDNVLESNGFEEFSSNLYKSKLLPENELSLNESSSELDVRQQAHTDIDSN